MTEITSLRIRGRTARDLMTADPVAVYESTNVRDAAEKMAECDFSAMPVVNDDGRIVGVVSQTDIVRHVPRGDAAPSLSHDSPTPDEEDELEGTYSLVETPRVRVREIMTPEVYSVWPNTTVHDVVSEMVKRDIRRVFVVEDQGKLVGVISAIDVLTSVILDDD